MPPADCIKDQGGAAHRGGWGRELLDTLVDTACRSFFFLKSELCTGLSTSIALYCVL